MIEDNGTIAGNITDKYNTKNPILRWVMQQFINSAHALLMPIKNNIHSVTELGCGEGHFTVLLDAWGFSNIRACDISTQIITMAHHAYANKNIQFFTRSIYDITATDAADLLVCVEVLEHLENPREALRLLSTHTHRYCLLSVPHEPWWRIANMLRGKYITALGNTPGHLQHWSANDFCKLVEEYFEIIAVRSPFPWTMILARKRH